eukprot:TRINITY_DN9139_c0_g1_i1.p1 TRINITY_DN9139_c0_g1~~TRINITY_DN9139_c0_g1_i1.p1  ORF type:complete len:191 (-),score=37.32 TRINITY_DN9139_c0_g1_i1:204-776(-)
MKTPLTNRRRSISLETFENSQSTSPDLTTFRVENLKMLEASVDTQMRSTKIRGSERDFILEMSKSWLKDEQPRLTQSGVEDAIDAVQKTFQVTGNQYSHEYLLPIAVYTDRYVRKCGKLHKSLLLPLLFMSTVLTIKFWLDDGIGFQESSKLCGVTVDFLIGFEQKFLSAIDFELFISDDDSLVYLSALL